MVALLLPADNIRGGSEAGGARSTEWDCLGCDKAEKERGMGQGVRKGEGKHREEAKEEVEEEEEE